MPYGRREHGAFEGQKEGPGRYRKGSDVAEDGEN